MYLAQKILNVILICYLFASCIPVEIDGTEKQEYNYEDNERSPSSISSISKAFRKARTGDRFYIASVLKRVFGSSYDNNSYIRTNIIVNQGVFGGGCDKYENSTKGENSTTAEFLWNVCYDSNWNTDQILESSTLKEGWIVRTCELIIKNNSTAVTHALNQAKVGSDIEVDYDGLNRLYQLFYITDDLPNSAYNTLIKYKDDFSRSEFYTNSLLTFCVSSAWINL